MNTSEAAAEARVTLTTIRAWARRGVIAARKTAGRWDIDADSLAHRIAIGRRTSRMTEQPMYRVDEVQVVQYGKERTAWRIVRTDGTPAGYGRDSDHRIAHADFFKPETAEFYAKFYENTPSGYYLELKPPRANAMFSTSQWIVTGSHGEDPDTLKMYLDADRDGAIPIIDILIGWVTRHAEGAAQRIADKAERDAVAAAEAVVREARESHLAAIRRQKGELATPRQVEFILQLLAARERSGEGGGFFNGPTDRVGIEELSKGEASLYIDSLKGDY